MPPRKRAKFDTGNSLQSGAYKPQIMEKLKALGYSDEDLDARFDDRNWKWHSLLDDDSISTEAGWDSILPQLEKTIKLRQKHKALMFHAWRRSLREAEIKTRLAEFRPQLEHITLHKLFIDADLLELPVVKELVEEDECRVPLTDERWSTVQNILVQSVEDHATRIERHCFDAVIQAKYRAKELARERWSEEWDKEWEEREEELDREEEEHLDDPDYERPENSKYLDEPTEDLIKLEKDYEFDMQGLVKHSESVPLCLLSAQSLLEQEVDGIKRIISYVDILRSRATRPIIPDLDSDSNDRPWCREKISSSAEIIDTAVLLLRCLGISPRKEMVIMAACGKAFRCTRCYRGPASKGVSWAELVQHFLYEYRQYGELCKRNYNRNEDVPLRNDHTLVEEEYRLMGYGVPAEILRGAKFKGGRPPAGAGRLYTQLVSTWVPKIPPSLRKYLHLDDDEPVGIPWGDLGYDSPDELMELMDRPYKDVFPEKCGLCAKLGVEHREKSRIFLNDHLERKHGVDPEGHLLGAVDANS
ncbi:hypothetical protein SCHPADRAFT_936165 [Schizopora paradoxa]|uniref:Uncharacterized protein n=1 Tax=Schizopora paradoxa TaxID=27342 RepID=A0A0H2S3F0_9AGAM|nr:hypothetical protein SCHPADRAFT_936165 [Schizopora paradoxa]